MGSPNGAVVAATISIIILFIILILAITNLNPFQLIMKFMQVLLRLSSKFINKRETAYHRDLEIGKIDEKRRRVKIYRFLNDLTIDLGLKQQGATPYEFLFIVIVITTLIDLIMCQVLFGSFVMAIIFFPILLVGIICGLYTKANVEHDRRIEAIIEAENIICNNITAGVLVAVKGSIHVIPKEVRGEFKDFIDNVESKNFHIRTALIDLNSRLGSVADDFIKKCINFETAEEHGIAGIFRDVVEINNIKMENRMSMKRKFEEVVRQFLIGAGMILVFLALVLVVYPDIRSFYFTTMLGQIIIALDILVFISEFVYLTYLRAQEV